MNKEIHIYVASKLMYNIGEIIKFKKANKIDADVEKKILCVIKDNRKYLKYYFMCHKKLGILKNCLMIYISPSFFVNHRVKINK